MLSSIEKGFHLKGTSVGLSKVDRQSLLRAHLPGDGLDTEHLEKTLIKKESGT